MSFRPLRIFAALCFLVASASLVSAQPDVHAIADKVDQRYNHMQTLQAQFAETYSGAGMTRHESGTLELKKPGRMRWDYDEPRPKMFLTDGSTAWFYVPGERQVRRAPVKQIRGLALAAAVSAGQDEAGEGVRRAGDCERMPKPVNAGDIVLRGVPEGHAGAGVEDAAGGHSRGADHAHRGRGAGWFGDGIPLSSAEGERPNSGPRFKFTPPPGVEVVQGTELDELVDSG